MASFFDDSDPDVIVRQIRNFVIRECDANDIHLKDIDIFLCPKWWNTVGGYITPTPHIEIVRGRGDFTKPIAWSVDIKLNENLIGGFYVERKTSEDTSKD